eukprot:6201862-Pleurochrysis_carterae.AAC.2
MGSCASSTNSTLPPPSTTLINRACRRALADASPRRQASAVRCANRRAPSTRRRLRRCARPAESPTWRRAWPPHTPAPPRTACLAGRVPPRAPVASRRPAPPHAPRLRVRPAQNARATRRPRTGPRREVARRRAAPPLSPLCAERLLRQPPRVRWSRRARAVGERRLAGTQIAVAPSRHVMGIMSTAGSRAAPLPPLLLPARGAPSATRRAVGLFASRRARAAAGRRTAAAFCSFVAVAPYSGDAAARARSWPRSGPGACALSSGASAISARAHCANPAPRADTAGIIPARVARCQTRCRVWPLRVPPACSRVGTTSPGVSLRPSPCPRDTARWGGASLPTPKRPLGVPPPPRRPERSLLLPCARALRAPLEQRCPRRDRPQPRRGGAPVGHRRWRPRRAKYCWPSRPAPVAWGRWSRDRRAGDPPLLPLPPSHSDGDLTMWGAS